MDTPAAPPFGSHAAPAGRLLRAFTAHPASVGESYFQHLASAAGFSGRMLFGGCACLLHAVFPFLCVRTGSRCITELHERMVLKRSRLRPRD